MLLRAKVTRSVFVCLLLCINVRLPFVSSISSPVSSTDTAVMEEFHRSRLSTSGEESGQQRIDRVCIIGSGNWGSAIAKIVGGNCERLPYFHSQVNMWVYEEFVSLPDDNSSGSISRNNKNGTAKLSEVINTRHENIKYLPSLLMVADLSSSLPWLISFDSIFLERVKVLFPFTAN